MNYLTAESITAMTTHGIPERMQGALIRYFDKRIPPGDFLQAVLSNDLIESFGRADYENATQMRAYILWLYNEVPGRANGAWGSRQAVKNWLNGGDNEDH